ncbi:MAG: hypothetical protein KDA84_17385 [Planctomycetaceae bacterium]|nr:hypothetical protein [Planctomycetaceae bacterium]
MLAQANAKFDAYSHHRETEMKMIASTGVNIKVTPCGSLFVKTEEFEGSVDDSAPFVFRVEGRLEDGQIFYGLYGPVISGPDRYRNLICNIIVRADGTDWRKTRHCSAKVVLGPSQVQRDHRYDFRDPDGVIMDSPPLIVGVGMISVTQRNSAV